MLTDEQLLSESRKVWRLFGTMSVSHGDMYYAIDAHRRGLNAKCWWHLFEWVLHRDEARKMLRAMCRGGR